MLELRLKPSRRELGWFGLLLLAFFWLVAGIVLWTTSARGAAIGLGAAGAALAALYYGLRPLRLPLFRAWMRLVHPIGWVVSHLLMAAVYFFVVTPMGWALRAARVDPLERRRTPEAETYWTDDPSPTDPSSYFRQF